MAEAGLKKSTAERNTRTSDGGESNGGGGTSDKNSSNSKPPQSSQQGDTVIAGNQSEAGKPQGAGPGGSPTAQVAGGRKNDGYDSTHGLFVAGGAQEWEILLALFSSNLCFATEGPGRNNDHYDSVEDAEEKGQEKESKKGKDGGTHDQPEPRKEENLGRKQIEAVKGEETTLERFVARRRH